MTTPRPKSFMSHLLIIVAGLSFLIPFLWMLSTSLKSDQDVFRTPPSMLPHVDLYRSQWPAGTCLPRRGIDGEESHNFLYEIADGHGVFVDPDDAKEVLRVHMNSPTKS